MSSESSNELIKYSIRKSCYFVFSKSKSNIDFGSFNSSCNRSFVPAETIREFAANFEL